MTRAGYISDRSCPVNPAHGDILGMQSGGYYCPAHEHDMNNTQSWWTETEFEAIRSNEPTIPIPTRKQERRKR